MGKRFQVTFMASLPTSVDDNQTAEQDAGSDSFLVRPSAPAAAAARAAHRRSFCCGVFVLSLCLFHSFWLALLPAAAVLLSLSEFVFPVRYTLTAQSATARHGLTPWKSAGQMSATPISPTRLKLSPLRAKNSRFEPLRGVFLRFDEDNREAVIAAVRRCRQECVSHG